jgi:uncharacterized membrane protein
VTVAPRWHARLRPWSRINAGDDQRPEAFVSFSRIGTTSVGRASNREMGSMSPSHVLVHTVLIGIIAGLLSLTAPAVVAWGAHLGWLTLQNTALAFVGSTTAVVIFTLLAVFEIGVDKRPSTPSRLAPGVLIARVVCGGFCGAAIAASGGQAIVFGVGLGAVGAVAGAYVGHALRTRLVRALTVPDWVIAVLGDAVAIGGGLAIVAHS